MVVWFSPFQVFYLESGLSSSMRFTQSSNLDTTLTFTSDHLAVRCGSVHDVNLCGNLGTGFPAANDMSDPLIITRLDMQVRIVQLILWAIDIWDG